MISTPSSTVCEPRWATPRSPERKTIGHEVGLIAKKLGKPFMPWQHEVALVLGELMVDEEVSAMLGREILVPAYPEGIVTIERQAGKTIFVWSWINHRAMVWPAFDGARQNIAYTAQSGADGRSKFRKDFEPMIRKSSLRSRVAKSRFSAEDTGLDYVNGSIFTVWATSMSAGHGQTVDLGVLDEMFDDEDDRREQAFVPAMATRHDRQKLICSTAEDARGVVLRRKRNIGRRAVDTGRREGTAFFEWSADPADDPESPETWRRCHPALGFTITERTIRQAMDEMRKEDGDLTEFKRAWLNIPIEPADGGGGGFGVGVWAAVCDPDPVSGPPVALAVDVAPEDRWAAIAAATPDVVKLLAHRPGPDLGWLVDEANRLSAELDLPVVFQGKGPAGYLASRLHRPEPRDFEVVANGCAEFANAVNERRLRVRSEDALDAAVEGAGRRTVGERWVWDRRTADVTPLMAVSIAFAEAQNKAPSTVPLVEWV